MPRGIPNAPVTDGPTVEERAARAQARRYGRGNTLRPIEQIRPFDMAHAPEKGAGAYYLRPDGATIMDALIWYPNGASLPREDDPKRRFSANADLYRARQARKGFEYVGPSLTSEGAARLVAILERNRPDEVERLEDEIALCDQTIKNTDRPDVRDHERRRREQLAARLERVRNPFDPDALVKELEEIANAQQMANVPPAVLQVMRRMLAASGQAVKDELITRFQKAAPSGDEAPEGVAHIG